MALKYRRQGLPLEDLVQEGCTGLMRAASKYDYRRGVKFSTYATWWVRQSVRRALDRTGRTIRLPTHIKDQLYRLEQVEVQLQQELQRQPSLHELAAEMELEVGEVRRIRHLKGRMISLDQPLESQDSLRPLVEQIEDPNAELETTSLADLMDQQQVQILLSHLSRRERQILSLRFGLEGNDRDETLRQIGERLKLSLERVRQIEQDALNKLIHLSRQFNDWA